MNLIRSRLLDMRISIHTLFLCVVVRYATEENPYALSIQKAISKLFSVCRNPFGSPCH